MTPFKRRKQQTFVRCILVLKNAWLVLSHAQISCHNYTMSEADDIVMMTWNFCMRKYNKRIFDVFSVRQHICLRRYMLLCLKTFQFITVCKGDMNHYKPKTAKITLGLNLGLYHHVLNSCCPSKREPFWIASYLWNMVVLFDACLNVWQLFDSGVHWTPGVYYNSGITDITGFYRAMHFSAKRGIAIACRLSVCPSVTLVNCDHIGWNSSKIISPLVSLERSLFATPTRRVCSKGNTPKFLPE